MHFIDEVKIYLKAGDGGDGAASFRREKFIEFGGPDGGNGGKGADIIFKATSDLNTLIDFRYKQHFKAQKGTKGMGQNKTGKSGDLMLLMVPVGTAVYAEDKETLLADITFDEQEVLIAKGGDGGRGNASYTTSVNRAPRRALKGWPGQELWVWLQLKLLSDVGLLGLPNAGKSTFLSVVSAAKPKIADYPFTTLKPQLGVVSVGFDEFVIADLPGLIEGASNGKGLGDRFLRHMERCRVLLHLIDATSEDVIESYDIIRREVEGYGRNLLDKHEIVVLNKQDLVDADELQRKVELLQRHIGKKVMTCSGATRDGLQDIIQLLNSSRQCDLQ